MLPSGPTPPLVLVAFIFPAFAGFNFGYDIGSTSGAVQQLRAVLPAVDADPLLQGLLTSGSLCGTVIGVALSFALGPPLGRRGELLLSSVLYLLGTLVTTLVAAGVDIDHLFSLVLAGRIIYGVGVAFAMHAAPVYIAEISPPSIRGFLVALKEGFIVLGILAGFLASATVSAIAMQPATAFRAIWAPPLAFGLIVLFGMLGMPPSPRWLMLRALAKRRDQRSSGLVRTVNRGGSAYSLHADDENADDVELLRVELRNRAADSLRRLRSTSLFSIECDEEAVDNELRGIVAALSDVQHAAVDGACHGENGSGNGGGNGQHRKGAAKGGAPGGHGAAGDHRAAGCSGKVGGRDGGVGQGSAQRNGSVAVHGSSDGVGRPGGANGGSAIGSNNRGDGGQCREVMRARRALLAGLGIVFLQQVTGQPSVLYYQEAIFRDAGFGTLASYASVIVGGAKLLATLFTVARVEHYGRRPLLFAGISMMLVALFALALAFLQRPAGSGAGEGGGRVAAAVVEAGVGSSQADAMEGEAQSSSVTAGGAIPVLIVSALMLYVCGYQIGFGPIAWLLISEVFPLRTRGLALSIAVAVNFGSNFIVTFTLPTIQAWADTLAPGRGMAGLFALYAALCILSLGFVAAYVPETKGKSLEQIEFEMTD